MLELWPRATFISLVFPGRMLLSGPLVCVGAPLTGETLPRLRGFSILSLLLREIEFWSAKRDSACVPFIPSLRGMVLKGFRDGWARGEAAHGL